MSALLNLIEKWKNGRDAQDCDFRDLFKEYLHKDPYCLRYALDKQRPDLFMIYMGDNSDRTNAVVRECNGIILNRNDYSIVAYGMKRMVDITNDYYEGSANVEWDSRDFEEAEDGTVLTVFHYDGSWIVSTKRNIDANNVKWSSQKNFYQLLSDAMPGNDPMATFEKDLDKKFTYSFILLHPENHLVVIHQSPEIIYVSKRDSRTLQEWNVASQDGDESKMFSWARKRQSLNKEDAQKRLSQRNDGNGKRGIILSKFNGKDYDRVMIDYKWFSEANYLRKGMPSLHLSYLACGPDEKQKMRSYFGNQNIFNVIDNLLRNLIRYIFAVYKDSYVRKQFKVPHSHPIYKTISKLHYNYKTTGEPVRIHHVIDIVDTIPTHILDSMLLYFSTYGFYPPVDTNQQQDQSNSLNASRSMQTGHHRSQFPSLHTQPNVAVTVENPAVESASNKGNDVTNNVSDSPQFNEQKQQTKQAKRIDDKDDEEIDYNETM